MSKTLAEDGERRLHLAWRQSTWKKYQGQFHSYAVFCYLNKMDPLKPTVNTVITYTESLIRKGMCFNTINNHLSGVKTYMLWHNYDSNVWGDIRLRWNRRSAKMVLRETEKIQTVVPFRDWLICLFLTENIQDAPLHLALIICFTGLLRISNVAIVNVQSFDVSHNAQIKDMTDEGDGLKLLLKWSKSNQFGRDILVLPASKTKILCPVTAWRQYTNDLLG